MPCKPTPENEEAPENRYLIEFSEFARVNIPNVWKGDRNPVKYRSADDLGIDFSKLKWEPMPERDDATDAVIATLFGCPNPANRLSGPELTMAEAKKGLALTFNVPARGY